MNKFEKKVFAENHVKLFNFESKRISNLIKLNRLEEAEEDAESLAILIRGWRVNKKVMETLEIK